MFVHEDGEVRLKRGDELKVGDRLVAPRTVHFPESAPERIDLLRALHAVPEGGQCVRSLATRPVVDADVEDRIAHAGGVHGTSAPPARSGMP